MNNQLWYWSFSNKTWKGERGYKEQRERGEEGEKKGKEREAKLEVVIFIYTDVLSMIYLIFYKGVWDFIVW